jgi:hypothetical protein
MLRTATSTDVCEGSPRVIIFSLPPQNGGTYTWYPANITNNSNTFTTYSPGIYSVRVVSSIGCLAQSSTNVNFKNKPTARISGKTDYCLGDEAKLIGYYGTTNTYQWNITGPTGYNFTTGNIHFTPTLPGTYSAHFTISNGPCSAESTVPVLIYPKPAAPIIGFGSNECIHIPPVVLASVNNQSLYWSNGYHGITAHYYTHGYANAHYIDANTGCASIVTSPTLTINPKEICVCDEVTVVREFVDCFQQDCELIYRIGVVVCNTSSTQTRVFDQFYTNNPNFQIIGGSSLPIVLAPGACQLFVFGVNEIGFSSSPILAEFVLYDQENNCEKKFVVSNPYLVPNPTQNAVRVEGIIPSSITEIAVIDMTGKHIKTIKNSAQFEVGELAPGSYIVKVATTNKEVKYLKLIKQ